ncbi:myosin heavy chain, cardiac muscle isoform-like [Ylistrum balloti]|uniref:myosin heavy chain, cardiac muscle isoform-like n=1 Tax=Ylistrum balloti TaxID=509963 RepID=UPI002905A38E|nr:myosin heavy chain, cardiac muscle isoform-like [Ylistrum balloti]
MTNVPTVLCGNLKAGTIKDDDVLRKNLQTCKVQLTQTEEMRKDLEDKVKRLEKEKSDLSKNRSVHGQVEQLQRENTELTKNRKDLEDKVKRLEKEKSDLSKNRSVHGQVEQLQRENTELTKNRKDLEDKVKRLEKEKSDLSKNRSVHGQVEQLQRENTELTKNREMLEDTVKALKREISDISRDRENLQNQTQQMDMERNLSGNKKKQEEAIQALQQENASMIRQTKKQEETIEALRQENTSLKCEKPENVNRERKMGNLSPAEIISKLENEVEDLRIRLSKIAGAQLTDNNPAIADLSDPNRPLSLGEKFSELYDNEWTDAMEELLNTLPDEKTTIQQLLTIVCDAYTFCVERSDKFMNKINGSLKEFSGDLSSSEMPKEVAKINKDYRKSLAVYAVTYLQEDFTKKTRSKAKIGQMTEAYMKRCVHISWFMAVQDPKVKMTAEASTIFDEERYKAYTRKGKQLDYIVWPALHLHEGGPLISKGVAQGKP